VYLWVLCLVVPDETTFAVQLNNNVFLRSDAIEGLPLVTSPEVLGLHRNADIGCCTQAARHLWDHLMEMQPQTGEHTFPGVLLPQVSSA
jgi:hypothetical protein